MVLSGDLRSIPLANVLQDLALNELTGTLAIDAGAERRSLWFEKGRLRLLGRGTGRAKAARKKESREALEARMTDEVCELLRWPAGGFRFVEGKPDGREFETSLLDLGVRLPVEPILLEAARRMDEWSEIRKFVLSADEILVSLGPPAEGDATRSAVAARLDGETSLAEIAEDAGLAEFAVVRAAAECVRDGAARPLSVAEVAERARAAAAKRAHDRAARLARFGLAREPHHLGLRASLARSLESLGRADEAVAELRLLAAAQVESGERKEAAASCRRILDLAPRDLFALERLFGLLLELGEKDEAIERGRALVAAHGRAGLPEKAKEVCDRLAAMVGEDDALLESTVDIAAGLGDRKKAGALLRRLFARALARGDDGGALRHARAVLRLDPLATDVARRAAALRSGAEGKRRRLRRRAKVAVAAAVAFVVVGGPLIYEVRSRERLAGIRAAAPALRREGAASLLRAWNEGADAARWSLAGFAARRERAGVEREFVEADLPRPPVEESSLVEALRVAGEARGLVRGKGARRKVEGVVSALEAQAGEARERLRREAFALARRGDPEARATLASMTQPLALDAVERVAAYEDPAVRAAAVRALSGQPGDRAFESLVGRLAVDPDEGVRAAVLEGLERRSGQRLGADPSDWLEWLRRTQAAAGSIPPVHALLAIPRASVGKGEPIEVEWRLVNLGTEAVRFAFTPVLSATTFAGEACPALAGAAAASRSVELHPGEFVGGRCDLRGVVDGLDALPRIVVSWGARIDRGERGTVAVSAAPRLVELSNGP